MPANDSCRKQGKEKGPQPDLVQIVHPSALGQDPACAAVDDLHFPITDDVLHIPLVQLPCAESSEHIRSHR